MRQHIIFQKLESAALFIVSTFIYFDLGFSILAYVLLLFVFDISMIGYVKNNKAGAYLYNAGHSLTIPLVILLAGWIGNHEAAIGFGLIWFAHIGLDRFLGYGLKLTAGFNHTHLGTIGKP